MIEITVLMSLNGKMWNTEKPIKPKICFLKMKIDRQIPKLIKNNREDAYFKK